MKRQSTSKPACSNARSASRRIALVTEELSSTSGSGGIGGAFHELAVALARAGHVVDIVFVPIDEATARRADLQIYYSAHGIRILEVPFGDHVWAPLSTERKAYGLFCYLRALETGYDFMHFHDYKGLGFYILSAKRQSLGFAETTMVVQTHGPTRWTLQANGHPFSHEDQLKIDFMERESIARADVMVSPSQYLVDWMAGQGWQTPPASRVHVIQNICTHLVGGALRDAQQPEAGLCRFNEIVFFGRHEERKGIVEFCDALDELAESLARSGTGVTFLGRFGEVNGTPSALYLARRAASWDFPLRILPDHDRKAATGYLAQRPGALIVVASPIENSPYAVLETIVLGKPLITSSEGGASELLDARSAEAMTCRISQRDLAGKIAAALRDGLMAPSLRVQPEATLQAWLDLHDRKVPASKPASLRDPSVAVAIVHHDRPEKLMEAVLSIAAQTYRNIEIVVVDDGSSKPVTHAALARMEPLFEKLGVRLIRQPNLYLGAARNRAARETNSDYLLFLDDDDIAFPTMVQTLVAAAEATGSAVVNCLNLFMEESQRARAFPFPDRFEQKVSYLPLGGPISLAPLENCFGSATAILRRDAFEAIGGYTEIFGVGHEDYELYVRLRQAGERIEICPIPLYLYEVGRPSMVSTTSRMKNFNRVATAIDAARLGEDGCADMVSLLAGRRAVEHTQNFRDYSISISPDAGLLREILSMSADAASYPERVAAYARNFGCEQYQAALMQVAASRSNAAQQATASVAARPAWQTRLPPAPPASRLEDTLMIGALVDMQCGRAADAVAGFVLSLERHERLGLGGIRLLRAFAADAALTIEQVAAVRSATDRLSLSDAEFEAAAPDLLRLALQAQAADTLFAISERALEHDEAHYLSLYHDVAGAVREGAFASGLTHFSSRREENRRGFALSTLLCRVLAKPGEENDAARLRGLVLAAARQAAEDQGAVRPSLLLAAE